MTHFRLTLKQLQRVSLGGAIGLLPMARLGAQNPNILTIVSGDHQTAVRGASGANFAPLVVRITAPDGAFISVPISFSCPAAQSGGMVCRTTPGNTNGMRSEVVSRENGQATLADAAGVSLNVTGGSGPLQIVVTAEHTNAVTFNLVVRTAMTMQIASGDNQLVTMSSVSAPLAVVVTDFSGAPVQGVTVRFACVQTTGCTMFEDRAEQRTALTMVTGADGRAWCRLHPSLLKGTLQVSASTDVTTPVTFNMSIQTYGNSIKIVDGDNQVVLNPDKYFNGTTRPRSTPIVVLAASASGVPAAGVVVTFLCRGECMMTNGVDNLPRTSVVMTTGPDGRAWATVLTNGPDHLGNLEIEAWAPNMQKVLFHMVSK